MKKIMILATLCFGAGILHMGEMDCSVKGTINYETFGLWSIDKVLFDYILSVLPKGSTMLEFGSGWASGQLSQHYTVYSIEHNKKWLGKYATHYIYAPIVDGWYDTQEIKKHMPDNYSLLLVDGPPSTIGRQGFLKHLDLFALDSVIIIFDDIHREADYSLMIAVAQKLGREPLIYDSESKKFGVLWPSR